MLLKKPKISVVGAAVYLSLGAFAAPAFAQQASGQQLERVEVTGSRILSMNAESAAPIQVMTSADIAASGAANLQDLLLKNPTFGTSGISRSNSNFQTTGAGVATVDLRNLGTSRTLVLVNGRRYVSGVPGDSAVDLNTIPTDFIERVEVMTGGASSTYGSDAVAGVVNIILKRNFNGLTLDAQVGQSSKSDDKKQKFAATWGTSSNDGKSNLMAHFGYSKQGEVNSRDRAASAVDQNSKVVGGKSKDPADLYNGYVSFSGFAPGGRYFGVDANGVDQDFSYDANGKQIPWSQNGPKGDGVGATGFNRSAFRRIAVPVDRLLLAAKGDQALSDAHQVFFEATYASTKATTNIEPFALGSIDIYPDSGGEVPISTSVNGKLVRNPLVPANLAGDSYSFRKRMSDFGPRTYTAERDTFRLVTGVKGEINKNWNYDAFAGYGFTKEAQNGTGQVNVLNFRNALEAIPDGKGGAMCQDANARAQGCVPVNIFGLNSISADAVKYIQAPQSLATKVTQKMAGASVNGEAFNLPAGPVGIAAGVEWREESSSTVNDALTVAGLNGGNKTPNTAGSFNVKEAFVEAKLPLLKDLPLVKTLDGTLAFRTGDYSTAGKANSWNAGLDWAANSTVRVRFTRAVSTRAPNIGELFQGPSQDFPNVNDPCMDVKSSDTGVLADRCKAAPGVLANMNANGGVFTLTQPDMQSVSGYNSGNKDLKPEKGTSSTLGVVITPTSVPLLKNFAFTADYFDISIDKAIANPGRQYALNQCYNGGSESFCKFITRRAVANSGGSAGALTYIDQSPVNSGGMQTRGVDLTANYAEKVGPGRLNSRLSYTHLIEGWTQATPEDVKDSYKGEVGAPTNKWTFNLGYDFGNWSVSTTTTYIGESYLDDQFASKYLNDSKNYPLFNQNSFKIASKTYFDLQGSYKFGKAQVYVGVDNAFDTKAPPIITGLPGNTTGAETAASVYDPIGRRYYVGIRYSM
nr:TonB-dependent receptor [uncultured Roseateles sp.]